MPIKKISNQQNHVHNGQEHCVHSKLDLWVLDFLFVHIFICQKKTQEEICTEIIKILKIETTK